MTLTIWAKLRDTKQEDCSIRTPIFTQPYGAINHAFKMLRLQKHTNIYKTLFLTRAHGNFEGQNKVFGAFHN